MFLIGLNNRNNFAEENAVDPEITRKIDIGFPQLRPSRAQQVKERLGHMKAQRSNPLLEKEARAQNRKLTFALAYC